MKSEGGGQEKATSRTTLVEALWSSPDDSRSFTILGRGEQFETRTHQELLHTAEAVAAGLADRMTVRNEPIGVITRTRFDSVINCLAVLRAGGALIPLEPPGGAISRAAWTTDISHTLSKAGCSIVMVGEQDRDLDLDKRVLRATELGSSTGPLGSPEPGDVGVIHLSSGTTGSPKGIVLNHDTFANRLLEARKRARGARELHWHPLHLHGGMATALLYPIALGLEVTLMPPQLLAQEPARWLVEISRRAIDKAGGANFAYSLATREIERGLPEPVDLSGWRIARVGGGEAPHEATIARFVEVAGSLGFRTESLTNAYASTETGIVSDLVDAGTFHFDRVDRENLASGIAKPASEQHGPGIATAGPPLASVSLRVVSSSDEDLPERYVGQFLVRTPYLMDGYLNDPLTTKNAYKDGWFMTGDLGYIADGQVFITGRAKDVIIVRGRNYHADDLEHIVLRSLPGIDGRCAAFGVTSGSTEGVVVVVEAGSQTGSQTDTFRKNIVRELWSATGLSAKDIVVMPPGTLPTTASGKLQRAKIKAHYETGTLEDLPAAHNV